MADFRQVLLKYGGYVELVAYVVSIISVFLPFIIESMDYDYDFGSKSSSFKKSISFLGLSSIGILILILIIISAILVALNNFAKNVIDNLKNKYDNKKIVDVTVETIPLIFTFISVVVAFLIENHYLNRYFIYLSSCGVGAYLFFIAMIIAMIVRIAYLIVVKEYFGKNREDFRQILKKYGGYVELVAYLVAIISVFLPFIIMGISDSSFNESVSFVGISTSGIVVLILIVISAVVVAINTFAKKIIDNLKNNKKNNAKIIDIIVETIPFVFTLISIIIALITKNHFLNKYFIYRNVSGVGSYLLFFAMIIAVVVRAIYLIIVKKCFDSKEVKTGQTEQAINQVVVPVN